MWYNIIDKSAIEGMIIMRRVFVAGGRDFGDYSLLATSLDRILEPYQGIEIVSGHAKNADQLGEQYAREHDLPCAVFPAEWTRFGKRAGFLRNAQMLEYALKASPLVIAFWDGRSHGTEDMIKKARAVGVECVVVSYPKETSE